MPYSPNRIAYYRDRCRPPLTQKDLAQAFGKHVNTIVLWEKLGAPSPAALLQLVGFFVAHGAISDELTARQFWAVSGRRSFAVPPELAAIFAPTPAPAAAPRPEAMPLEALPPPAPIPALSLLPLHRNRIFVGRTAALLALAAALRESGTTAAMSGPWQSGNAPIQPTTPRWRMVIATWAICSSTSTNMPPLAFICGERCTAFGARTA